MANTVKKNQKADIPTKNGNSYSYKYTDLAQVHDYLESINAKYIQQIKKIEGDDYIMTRRCFDDKWEEEWLQGCKVVDATLYGNENPAQKQGSAITYARRYSVMMAFGLATEDDDGNSLNPELNKPKQPEKEPTEEEAKTWKFSFGKYKGETMEDILCDDEQYVQWFINKKANSYDKKCYELLSGEKLPTDEEVDERIKMINEINNLEMELDIPHEKTLEICKVKSMSEMTAFQLTDCIAQMKKAIEEKMKK